MTIGATIRQLRQKLDITQEQLAEALGITSRAVSQWENGRTVPDISQLPALANFFDVTTDRLLGVDITRRNEDITGILEHNRLTFLSKGDSRSSINYLAENLKKYPNAPELLDALCASLYSLYFQSGEQFDDTVKRQKAEEIIKLCNKGICCSGKNFSGDHFKQILVYMYIYLGDKIKAQETALSLPHIHTTCDMLYPRTLEGKEALKAWQELLYILIWSVSFVSGKIKSSGNYSLEEKAEIMMFREKIIRLASRNEKYFNDLLLDNSLHLSNIYLKTGDKEKSLDELENAFRYAEENSCINNKPCWFSEIGSDNEHTRIIHSAKTPYEHIMKYIADNKYNTEFHNNKRFREMKEKISDE